MWIVALLTQICFAAVSSRQFSVASDNFWTEERIRQAHQNPIPISSRPKNPSLLQNTAGSCPSLPSKPLTGGNYSQSYPWIGRLLVGMENNKTGYCSASVVQSSGSKMIAAAAHCIMDTNGKTYSHPLFIPQYQNGNAPLGHWKITGAWWWTCWSDKPNSNNPWDYAFYRLENPILPRTGGLKLQINVAPSTPLLQLGYPGTTSPRL